MRPRRVAAPNPGPEVAVAVGCAALLDAAARSGLGAMGEPYKGPPSTVKDAIKIFEQSLEGKEGYTGPKSAVDCEDVRLCPIAFQAPCIQKLDASINTLKKCKHLRLSTNSIDKMIPLDLDNLEILSMGRNQIKRIEGLDNVKDTLKQLWLSYNGIAVLAGVEKLVNLEVLYLSNCKVASWSEVERLKELPKLRDLLLAKNPIHLEYGADEARWRIEVIKRLPNLKILDGELIGDDEREEARKDS